MGLEALAAGGRQAGRNARAAAGVFVCACLLLLSGCASLWPQTAELREALPAGLSELQRQFLRFVGEPDLGYKILFIKNKLKLCTGLRVPNNNSRRTISNIY